MLGAGTTPLLRAAKAGDTPVVKLLLEKGANAEGGDAQRRQRDHDREQRRHSRRGHDRPQQDAEGRDRDRSRCSSQLAPTSTRPTRQGRTAAHGAALWGLTDVVKFLHANGAKLDVKDKRGLTALDHATGLAGGFGFGGSASVVHDDTAKAIVELGGIKGTPIPAAPGGGRRGDRNQDDPQDGDRN